MLCREPSKVPCSQFWNQKHYRHTSTALAYCFFKDQSCLPQRVSLIPTGILAFLSQLRFLSYHAALHCTDIPCHFRSKHKENTQKNCPLIPGGSQVDPATSAISVFIPSKGKKRKLTLGGISQGKLFSAQLIQSST